MNVEFQASVAIWRDEAIEGIILDSLVVQDLVSAVSDEDGRSTVRKFIYKILEYKLVSERQYIIFKESP